MREKPEPFYCAFRNADTYYPFNTLQAHMCERQCIKCECYQEGSNEFNPRHLPVQLGVACIAVVDDFWYDILGLIVAIYDYE